MMCVSTVDGVKLPVIHLDGVYADTYTPFITLLGSMYDIGADDLVRPSPPWTIHSMSNYLALTPVIQEKIEEVIYGIPNYWSAVPKRMKLPEEQVVFYVDRLPTKGLPVLDQTIKWIRRELNIPSPIVWVADAP